MNKINGRLMGLLAAGVLMLSLDAPALADLGDGLIGYWRLDEGSGAVAHDSAGGNDGTLHDFSFTGNSGWTSGKLGGGLAFDGTDDYVSTSLLGPLGADPRTITFWARTTNPTQWIVGAAYGGSADDPGSSFRAGFNVGCEGVTANVSWGCATYSASISDGAWHHYAWVLPEGATTVGEVKTYMDGVLLTGIGSSWRIDQIINTTSGQLFEIGTYHNWEFSFFFDGVLDEVRVYDRALSDSEMTELYRYHPPIVEIQPFFNNTIYISHPISQSPPFQMDALASPPGGSFKWEIINGQDKIKFLSAAEGDLADHVLIQGIKPSGEYGDVAIKVTYTVDSQVAEASICISVLKPSALSVKSIGPLKTYPVGYERVYHFQVMDHLGHPLTHKMSMDEKRKKGSTNYPKIKLPLRSGGNVTNWNGVIDDLLAFPYSVPADYFLNVEQQISVEGWDDVGTRCQIYHSKDAESVEGPCDQGKGKK